MIFFSLAGLHVSIHFFIKILLCWGWACRFFFLAPRPAPRAPRPRPPPRFSPRPPAPRPGLPTRPLSPPPLDLLLPSKLRLGAGDFPSRDPTEATSDVANRMLIGLPSKGTPLYCFMALIASLLRSNMTSADPRLRPDLS